VSHILYTLLSIVLNTLT